MSARTTTPSEKTEMGERATPSYDITLVQRMLSACTGSLLTSAVVTPFDVVRVRLQQQNLLVPSALKESFECCREAFWLESQAETSSLRLAPTGHGNLRALNPTSPIIEEFCISNSCAQDTKLNGTFQGLSKIARNEGIMTLYRGLSVTLLMAVPSNIVYFSGYEYLRDNSPMTSYRFLNPLLCGSLARILAATVVSPLELIKTRLQSMPTASSTSKEIMVKVLKNAYAEVHQRGIKSIFTGLELTLWRDVPFSGIYWACYEFISSHLKASRHHEKSSAESKIFFTSFVSGSLSGIVAALATNPFDVGKTRMQISHEQQKTSLIKSPNTRQPIYKFLYEILRNEGASALYVGVVPRCLKIAPSCAIMISTYEMGKRFFATPREA